jgi:2-hydroxychromene-2-carboxylate isomerase
MMIFAYDLGSPYAWLAAERIEDDAEWLPVLLGGVFKSTGRSSWALTDSRAAGIAEIDRRARERGLPRLRWPPDWPSDYIAVMRAAVWAEQQDAQKDFALAAFRIHFTEGRTLKDPASIAAAATAAGLDPDGALAANEDQAIKDALRANTERALELGVRGVPSFVVGYHVIWGDDRLDEALELVAKQKL